MLTSKDILLLPVGAARNLMRYGGGVLTSQLAPRFGQDAPRDGIFKQTGAALHEQLGVMADAEEVLLQSAKPNLSNEDQLHLQQELSEDVIAQRAIQDFMSYFGPKNKEEEEVLDPHAPPSEAAIKGLMCLVQKHTTRLQDNNPEITDIQIF